MAEIFEDLHVWKDGRELANRIYGLVREEPFSKDFALRNQIVKAAISVPSNIAEGFERDSDREFVRFLYFSKGSAGEVRSQLYHALDQGYIPEPVFREMRELCFELSKKLGNFIAYLGSSVEKKGKN